MEDCEETSILEGVAGERLGAKEEPRNPPLIPEFPGSPEYPPKLELEELEELEPRPLMGAASEVLIPPGASGFTINPPLPALPSLPRSDDILF